MAGNRSFNAATQSENKQGERLAGLGGWIGHLLTSKPNHIFALKVIAGTIYNYIVLSLKLFVILWKGHAHRPEKGYSQQPWRPSKKQRKEKVVERCKEKLNN